MKKTLEPEINQTVQYDYDKPAVKLALKLISDQSYQKVNRDAKNTIIEKFFEMGFTINMPNGVQKIHSKMLNQAILKVVSRVKPLDAQFHAPGAKPHTKKIVTQGVRTIADEGGFDSALRDKCGAYYTVLMYGDSFTGMWGNPNKKSKIPFVFSSIDNSNVYVNTNAIKMRGSYGKSVTQLFLVVPMRWDEAIALYPQLKTKGGAGRFPTDSDISSDTFSNDDQTINDEDVIEIGYLFDTINLNYTIMAGSAMTILEEYWHDDYPFMEKDEAYIPIMHHICTPSQKGFYNHGIGDIIYELAVISQQLLNMGTIGALEEALPLDLINVPKAKASSFLNQMLAAQKNRVQGKRPYIANEYDPNSPNSSQISVQTLQSQYGTRWSQLLELLNRELLRYGINLDEAAYQPNATATEVMAVEQAQVTFVKQMMENNASEYQFFYGVMLSMIRDFIPKNDKTPLNMTTTIYDESGKEMEISGITMGMVAKELKDKDYFVKVNSRSGAIPSGMMEMSQTLQTLQSTPPGSPAYFRSLQSLYALNDRDVSLEDLGFQGAQPQVAGGEVPENPTPSGTERTALNVRSKEVAPSIL